MRSTGPWADPGSQSQILTAWEAGRRGLRCRAPGAAPESRVNGRGCGGLSVVQRECGEPWFPQDRVGLARNFAGWQESGTHQVKAQVQCRRPS